MSEYTREEILKMIEENGGPRGLDLSRRDLSEIDLSKETIAKELERIRAAEPGRSPPWQAPSPWGINLEGVKLSEANLERAHLQGAYLFDACLEGANLGYTHLEEAFLFGSRLNRASLFEAHLEGASIGRAYFEQAYLCWTHLDRVDLSEASLLGTDFEGAYFNQTRMTKEQFAARIPQEQQGEYHKAREIYLLLKNNFNQIGRYDDASWAYVKEREMEKMTYHPKLARTYYAKTESLPEGISPKSWTWWRFYVKYTLKWLWDWIIEWLCGYGERPLNVVAAALGVLIIIFPFLYSLTGLAPRSGQNLLPRDLFLYSLYSFASMEHPTLQATSRIAQLFTGLESLSGIALLALLMYTLGRRISRS